MTISAPPQPTVWWRRTGLWWVTLSSVGIAVFAVVPYLMSSLPELARNDVGLADNFVHRAPFFRVALYVHMVGAGMALLLSPLQLSVRLRTSRPRLHRVVGRVVIAAIVVGGSAGIAISLVSSAGLVGTLGFGMQGVLWVGFALHALRLVRRGDLAAHRRWMIRTFALTYGGVTLRLWMALATTTLVAAGVDDPAAFDRVYLAMPFLCWVPNLLIAEWFLSKDPSSTPSAVERQAQGLARSAGAGRGQGGRESRGGGSRRRLEVDLATRTPWRNSRSAAADQSQSRSRS